MLNQDEDEDDESSEDVSAFLVHALEPVHTKRKWERKQKRSKNKRQTSKKIFIFAFSFLRSELSFTVVFPVFVFNSSSFRCSFRVIMSKIMQILKGVSLTSTRSTP